MNNYYIINMFKILNKAILFFFISLSLSTIIYILMPEKQNIKIPMHSNYSLIYKNNEYINSNNVLYAKIDNLFNEFKSKIAGSERIVIEYNKLDSANTIYDEQLKKINANNLFKEIFYKENKFYSELTIALLKKDNNLNREDIFFFSNIKNSSNVLINPEDGSAILSVISFNYSAKNNYSNKQIEDLAQKIEMQYSKLYNKKYRENLKEIISLLDNVYVPSELKRLDREIQIYSTYKNSNDVIPQIANATNVKESMLNNINNIKIEILKKINTDEKKINIINYDQIKILYTKAKLKKKFFIIILIIINILITIIYILSFKYNYKNLKEKFFE